VQTSVRAYAYPEEFEAAHTATKVELTPTERVPFSAHAVRLRFADLWLQQVHEHAPRIRHVELTPSRSVIKFLSVPGEELVIQGSALPYGAIFRHSQGHSFFERSSGELNWCSISLPTDQLSSAGVAISGRDLRPPRDASIVMPSTNGMTRLRQLHRQAAALASTAPEVLAAPAVSRGLEQALVEAMVDVLVEHDGRQPSLAQCCHAIVMRRFWDHLADNADRPMYVPEICAAIRVPERTLRLCCQEHLATSPKQYLMLRRLQQVRRALNAADPAETTVTEVATRFGFWHFGRLAGTYRSAFGETPSSTLHRSRSGLIALKPVTN